MTDLEALARRCEAATGDDADLIIEAATLMFDLSARIAELEAENARLRAQFADGLERAAQWHDSRCRGPNVFEQELHEISARALRFIAANPSASDMDALDHGQGLSSKALDQQPCPRRRGPVEGGE